MLVPSAGFKPATDALEVHCSIQLSYEGSLGHGTESAPRVSIPLLFDDVYLSFFPTFNNVANAH